MTTTRGVLLGLALLLVPHFGALAGNLFLFAADDQPVSAEFRGTEWGDEIKTESLPLRARVVTRRLATTPWGEVFRISFEDITSRAPQRREIETLHFIVTDEKIYLLDEIEGEHAIERLTVMEQPPEFDPSNIRGLTAGRSTWQDGPWETTVTVKGDRCEYSSSHNSGHFARMIWQKGVGLIEYANGSGARQDGYSLKRAMTATNGKR